MFVLVPLILLAIIASIVLLSATEYWLVARTRDSGVFMYIGAEILEGKIPYRDIWDHKPPLIFYINALGYLINPKHWWGLWFIQFGFLYGSVLTAFVLIKRPFGMMPAVTSCALFVVLFQPLYEQGNFTEQYALLWQFAALYLFAAMKRKPANWHSYAIGVTGALAFLLRQNLIGVWVAIGLYLLVEAVVTKNWRDNVQTLGRMIIGGITPLLLVGLYFMLHGALDEMLDAIFAYNFVHVSSVENVSWYEMWLYGFQEVTLGKIEFPPFILMPLTFVIAVPYLRWAKSDTRPLIILSLILLPIEITFANLSGYNFPHYFLTWLPIFTLLCAIAVYILLQLRTTLCHKLGWYKFQLFTRLSQFMSLGIQGIIIFTLLLKLYPDIGTYLEYRREFSDDYLTKVPNFTAEYVRLHTEPDDYILVWGAQTEVYDLSERSAPTRFIYQYPLTKSGYNVEGVTAEFYQDLLEHPPALIVDTRNSAVPPIDAELARNWQPRPGHGWHDGLQPVIDFFNENYELEFEVANAWYIYRLREASSN